jgi:putative intracellular protease/amidase
MRHFNSFLLLLLVNLTPGCTPPPYDPGFVEGALPSPDRGEILFVLTAAHVQQLADGRERDTGFFLNEFALPYQHLMAQGYQVTIATPAGVPATIDPESHDLEYWVSQAQLDASRAHLDTLPTYASPLSLEQALDELDRFDGLIVPGGQGVMMDLYGNPLMQELLMGFAQRDLPVGLICHAPALLLDLPEENPFKGRRVTSVSRLEEIYIERIVMKGQARDRLLGKQLKARYDHKSARPKANHAVRDCNLVTSQNPFSGEAFARAFKEALLAHEQGFPCKTF